MLAIAQLCCFAMLAQGAAGKNPLVKLIEKIKYKRVTLVIRKQDVSGFLAATEPCRYWKPKFDESISAAFAKNTSVI